MVYRPTVRYDDRFRSYVDSLFQATTLDRNQIIRLALFVLPYSIEGRETLSSYSKEPSPLPSPDWEYHKDCGLWLEKTMRKQAPEEGTGTSETNLREERPDDNHQEEIVDRPEREDSQQGREVCQESDWIEFKVGSSVFFAR